MKRYFLPLAFGSILIGLGIILSIFEFSFFSYYNYLPENNYEKRQEHTYYSISDKSLYINTRGNSYNLIQDNNLTDQVKVTLYYYPDFVTLNKSESEGTIYKQLNIKFNYIHNNDEAYKQMLKLLSTDLKRREMHNYTFFFRPTIEIRVNPLKINKVRIVRY
jgi:ArsR family metal-binding transcriptional regulator